MLKAAGTKWNFLPFRSGLVGGHCIDVDPYYLTHKAEATGYHPQVILAGYRNNDGMGADGASQVVGAMIQKGIAIKGARILTLGPTFKENCPDLRNTRVIDVVEELRDYGIEVEVHDPWVDPQEAQHEYGIALTDTPLPSAYDGIILTVANHTFLERGASDLRSLARDAHVFYDLKCVFDAAESDLRL